MVGHSVGSEGRQSTPYLFLFTIIQFKVNYCLKIKRLVPVKDRSLSSPPSINVLLDLFLLRIKSSYYLLFTTSNYRDK